MTHPSSSRWPPHHLALGCHANTTLKVPGMTHPTCPIAVKKALQWVPGISQIAVSDPQKGVVVTFDNTKINEAALVKATTDAGYPSQPVKAPSRGRSHVAAYSADVNNHSGMGEYGFRSR